MSLEKMSFTNDELLEKWWQVLVECMSSEESTTDEEDEVIVVKSLPRYSTHVDRLFQHLNDMLLREKYPQPDSRYRAE